MRAKIAGIMNKVYLANPPQFFMFYTLMDHRNDVIKCSAREDSLSYCKVRYGYTVFIRISAHLHPTPPPFNSHSNSNKRPLLSRYHPKKGISTNLRLPRRRSFLQSVLQKPWFVTSSRFVITIYRFLAKYTNYTCWKWWKFNKRPLSRSKNLISAQGG